MKNFWIEILALPSLCVLFSCTPVQPLEPVVEQLEVSPVQWDGTKRADITYQLLLYSFADSDGDGYGDLKGLADRLDYIDQLGASAVWLSPLHPSPSYHGYDVSDYNAVNPRFGSMADFDAFVAKAHSLGIKVYLDLVLNHTSTSHEWFKSAASSKDSPYRDYYIFSDNPGSDIAAGAIPMIASEGSSGYDASQWFKSSTGFYHSHFNTSSFADLNYGPADACSESPAYRELAASADAWIERGVDGFRLDAVKHIYHNAQSTENPAFLNVFYNHCNRNYKSRGGEGDFYMVGEVFDEADKVAPYYKGLPALFEFSFWNRLQWAVNNGTGRYFFSDIDSYRQMYAQYRESPIVATKLSNHDENRAAGTLGKSLEKEKLAAAVLLTASGSPYVYQGEELGYWGEKSGGDEYVRSPIVWSASASVADAALRGKIDKAMLSSVGNVDEQSRDENSLLNSYRYFARLRNAYPALAQGDMLPHPVYGAGKESHNALAVWYRSLDGQRLLVVHNFSDKTVSAAFRNDNLTQPVALQGSARIKTFDGIQSLLIDGFSTVIFLQ